MLSATCWVWVDEGVKALRDSVIVSPDTVPPVGSTPLQTPSWSPKSGYAPFTFGP